MVERAEANSSQSRIFEYSTVKYIFKILFKQRQLSYISIEISPLKKYENVKWFIMVRFWHVKRVDTIKTCVVVFIFSRQISGLEIFTNWHTKLPRQSD